MNIIKKISLMFVSVLIAMSFAAPGVALAASNNSDAVCAGLALTGGKCGEEKADETGVGSTVKVVINLLSLLVGVVAVVMIIIGGFKYIISSGDSSNIKSAKDTILYAIIGLAIVALAQVIVRFVLTRVSAPPAKPKTSMIQIL